MENRNHKVSPVFAVLAAILLPGLGYWLIGQRRRAIYTGGGIMLLFVLGLLIAGVRVISVPGYDGGYLKYVELRRTSTRQYTVATTQPILQVKASRGLSTGLIDYTVTRQTSDGAKEERMTDEPLGQSLVIMQAPLSEIGDNLWFLGQMLTGPFCAASGYVSIKMAQAGIDKSYSRLVDIGSLYTAVAGMLNLLVIVDSGLRAAAAASAGDEEQSA